MCFTLHENVNYNILASYNNEYSNLKNLLSSADERERRFRIQEAERIRQEQERQRLEDERRVSASERKRRDESRGG